ncbi:MAG: tRNA-dihydrouridine synthase family protein [Deltaproteobacteria bacterium]|nr:tRNA-dihydrouridine synthase family protein [Deltaproteobacteria bacterium]MBW2366667.1 tRNA-dihydrouridine synthase family protein [Deltaproteobacteria bacterium]
MEPFLYLAPMRGYTNALYRNVFTKHFKGFDAAISPFIPTVTGKTIGSSHLRDISPENNHAMPIIPQIMGNDPDDFIRMARKCHDLGYKTVNWNLGCPFPMVAKKKRGSGLLPHPNRIDAFLDRVIPRIPNRLSIKTRIGRKTKEEIFNLIPIFNTYPLSEIIIHPRTGIQMYDGAIDHGSFAKCLDLLNSPVVYNGDIFDVDTFQALKSRYTSVKRWIIGRGALIDPFLPWQIKSGDADTAFRIEAFKRFHDDLFVAYRDDMHGPGHLIDKMKGYWQYFSRFFQDPGHVFKQIKKLKSVDRYQAVVNQLFSQEVSKS